MSEGAGSGHRTQFGNQEANLRFLADTGLLAGQKTVLEIGSGTGGLVQVLRQDCVCIVGIELDEQHLTRSRALYGPLPLFQAAAEHLPFEAESFDVVVSFDVFEHIPDSERHLSEVRRVLRPGGHYLLQTPNKWTNMVFETLRWKSLTAWREEHCSLHSYGELGRRLRRSGYEIEFYDAQVVTDFFREKVERHLGRAGRFLLQVLNPDHWPRALRPAFYLRATKL